MSLFYPHTETQTAAKEAEGAMTRSKLFRGSGRRRALATGFAGGVAMVMLAATAYACTQRVGTLLVCRPPASTYVSGSQCGQITGTTQTGSPTMTQAGARFSAKATNFQRTAYNVTWRKPGSGASCHTASADTIVLKSTKNKTSFLGPTFYAEFDPSANPVLVSTTTGQAKVCTQDMPDIIVGQIINVTVI